MPELPEVIEMTSVLTFNNGFATLEVSGIPIEQFGDVLHWLGSKDAGDQLMAALEHSINIRLASSRIGARG